MEVVAWIRYDYMGRPLVDWNIEEMCGYKPISTYYTDFGIAEWYGKDSIKDTYKRAIKNWGDDIKWATEIAMIMNWKWHEHSVSGNGVYADLYADLWEETDRYIKEHYKGDDLAYYYRTTD